LFVIIFLYSSRPLWCVGLGWGTVPVTKTIFLLTTKTKKSLSDNEFSCVHGLGQRSRSRPRLTGNKTPKLGVSTIKIPHYKHIPQPTVTVHGPRSTVNGQGWSRIRVFLNQSLLLWECAGWTALCLWPGGPFFFFLICWRISGGYWSRIEF